MKTLCCGICGSDLHAAKHTQQFADVARRSGSRYTLDGERDLVFGHEFCCEILEHGPGNAGTLKPGTLVCSMPMTIADQTVHGIGYNNDVPGGFAERLVLAERMLLPVPNGLAADQAALTEPMAVGWHAVCRARLEDGDVPVVIGCGPVGLAVIAGLKIRGAHPIIAADFLVSPRRALALRMGADIAIDLGEDPPYASWREAATPEGYRADRFAQLFGLSPKLRPAVLFECVGVPGVIQQMLAGAPAQARIVVVGVCMQTDQCLNLYFAIVKELNLQFVLGYTPEEFAASLRHIAEGKIDVAPLITGHVGLEGVAEAFDTLANPERHAKIVVEPWQLTPTMG